MRNIIGYTDEKGKVKFVKRYSLESGTIDFVDDMQDAESYDEGYWLDLELDTIKHHFKEKIPLIITAKAYKTSGF